MILYPAIDLKDGACVRLLRGDMAQATVYADDPAAQARAFAQAGCQWLHVVDLDGAFAGRPVNRGAIEAIVAAVEVPVQLGGGVRELATLEAWLAAGISRIVLGTAAVRDPAFVEAGDVVEAGSIVGLSEVMKTFTHLTYDAGDDLPARARIKSVLIGDGSEVNAGDALFELEST